MQIVSNEDNLHEMSKPVFWEKIKKDGRRTKKGHKSSPWAFGSGELKISPICNLLS